MKYKSNIDGNIFVTQHLLTEKHKSAGKREQKQMKNTSQQPVSTAMEKSDINYGLCETLLSANIPLN